VTWCNEDLRKVTRGLLKLRSRTWHQHMARNPEKFR